MNGSGGAIWKAGKPPNARGDVADGVAVPAQHVAGVLQLEEHRAAVDQIQRVQRELQRRHDPEVAAAAADRPEEVGMLALARDHRLAVSGDDVGRDQVVQGEPVTTSQIADPSARA